MIFSSFVEAFAASWIEISITLEMSGAVAVEAFAASWIEIWKTNFMTRNRTVSKPLRLRGLKS